MKKDRRAFFKKSQLVLVLPWVDFSFTIPPSGEDKVFFTNGIKICEVSPGEVFIWTRLCAVDQPNPIVHEREKHNSTHYPVNFDENQPVSSMDGAVEGRAGMVRVKILQGENGQTTSWHNAQPSNDFTVRIPLPTLRPGAQYDIEVEAKTGDGAEVNTIQGKFQTSPPEAATEPVTFVTSTCQYLWNYDDDVRGFKTYDSMSKLDPDFFVHTGDYVYYDRIGPMVDSIEKARHKWHAMNSRPSIRDFLQKTPMYMVKDDHDLLRDDTYPDSSPLGDFTLDDGLSVWRENVPFEDEPYRTIRWGKDLQIWLVEGREYRTKREPDGGKTPSIWGEKQKRWFEKTFTNSDATFKILFSATPVVGPDRESKKDNHANSLFQDEGDWLRQVMASQPGAYVVNGDRHWQYASVDADTGLWEFGSGAVSDSHAGGWDQNDWRPEHQFLRVKGGFLCVNVYRNGDQPCIDFVHYDVDGQIMHKEMFTASVEEK